MARSGDYLIITNNPLAAEIFSDSYRVEYRDRTLREVLIRVRDLVYAGHRLYTHPLSGSVKPNETLYKSVVISGKPGQLDEEGAQIIAESILAVDKFPERRRIWTDRLKEDFQLVDYTVLCSGLEYDAAAGLEKSKRREEN